MKKFCIDCTEKNSTHNLLINLKVLGSIGANQKLNTKQKYLEIDDQKVYQGALRLYRGDSRENTIEKINKILGECCIIIEDALDNQDNDKKYIKFINYDGKGFLELMYPILENVDSGLSNLKDTYQNDITTSSQLEMHLISIQKYRKQIARLIRKEEKKASKEKKNK